MDSVIGSLPADNSSIMDGAPIHPEQPQILFNPLESNNVEYQPMHIADGTLQFLGEMFRDELMQRSHSWEVESVMKLSC